MILSFGGISTVSLFSVLVMLFMTLSMFASRAIDIVLLLPDTFVDGSNFDSESFDAVLRNVKGFA